MAVSTKRFCHKHLGGCGRPNHNVSDGWIKHPEKKREFEARRKLNEAAKKKTQANIADSDSTPPISEAVANMTIAAKSSGSGGGYAAFAHVAGAQLAQAHLVVQDHRPLLDSGASDHIVPLKESFSTYHDEVTPIALGGQKSLIYGHGRGTAIGLGGPDGTIKFNNAIHAPDIRRPLVAFGPFFAQGYSIQAIGDDKFVIARGKEVLMGGDYVDGLFILDINFCGSNASLVTPVSAFAVSRTLDLNQWHRCLGHLNHKAVLEMRDKVTVKVLKISGDRNVGLFDIVWRTLPIRSGYMLFVETLGFKVSIAEWLRHCHAFWCGMGSQGRGFNSHSPDDFLSMTTSWPA